MFKILYNIIKLPLYQRKLYLLIKKITGFYPTNFEVYRIALTHKSVEYKTKEGKYVNNERLEFLGDAILGAAMAEELFNTFPNVDEGFLTNTRSKIVNRAFLNSTALKIGLSDIIRFRANINLPETNIPGDALEALIGALFIDKGYKKCKSFIKTKIIIPFVDLKNISGIDNNYKSQLLEWAHKNKKDINFNTKENYNSKNKIIGFEASILIEEEIISCASGKTKKNAHQKAAKLALSELLK